MSRRRSLVSCLRGKNAARWGRASVPEWTARARPCFAIPMIAAKRPGVGEGPRKIQARVTAKFATAWLSGLHSRRIPQEVHTYGTNRRGRPKSARTIPWPLHAHHLFDGQTQARPGCDAREDRRASPQTSLGLRPDGTIASLQPLGGRGPEGPGAIASRHTSRLPLLN